MTSQGYNRIVVGESNDDILLQCLAESNSPLKNSELLSKTGFLPSQQATYYRSLNRLLKKGNITKNDDGTYIITYKKGKNTPINRNLWLAARRKNIAENIIKKQVKFDDKLNLLRLTLHRESIRLLLDALSIKNKSDSQIIISLHVERFYSSLMRIMFNHLQENKESVTILEDEYNYECELDSERVDKIFSDFSKSFPNEYSDLAENLLLMYSSKKYSYHNNVKSLLTDLLSNENTLLDFISLQQGTINWENEKLISPSKIMDYSLLINKFEAFSQHLDKSGYAEDPMIDLLSCAYLNEKLNHSIK